MVDLLRKLRAAVPAAAAHCDTADGPAVAEGCRALATNEHNYVLKWIAAGGAAESRDLVHRSS